MYLFNNISSTWINIISTIVEILAVISCVIVLIYSIHYEAVRSKNNSIIDNIWDICKKLDSLNEQIIYLKIKSNNLFTYLNKNLSDKDIDEELNLKILDYKIKFNNNLKYIMLNLNDVSLMLTLIKNRNDIPYSVYKNFYMIKRGLIDLNNTLSTFTLSTLRQNVLQSNKILPTKEYLILHTIKFIFGKINNFESILLNSLKDK